MNMTEVVLFHCCNSYGSSGLYKLYIFVAGKCVMFTMLIINVFVSVWLFVTFYMILKTVGLEEKGAATNTLIPSDFLVHYNFCFFLSSSWHFHQNFIVMMLLKIWVLSSCSWPEFYLLRLFFVYFLISDLPTRSPTKF